MGNMLTEEVEIWVRDILDVIPELLGNAVYAKKLVFVPRRVFLNNDGTERKIDEIWTADWWLKIQVSG